MKRIGFIGLDLMGTGMSKTPVKRIPAPRASYPCSMAGNTPHHFKRWCAFATPSFNSVPTNPINTQ